jgi:hypothetical protein
MEPNRPLAKRLTDSPAGDRAKLWEDHLATLSKDAADAWIEAVAAANPDDPPPDDWGHPLSFKLPPVEPFPTNVYPESAARMVRHVAGAIGCPRDFPGLAVLAVAGAAIGRSVSLRLKDNYFASASVYAACVGLPGDGKSPAVNMVVSPMLKIDEGHFAKYQKERDAYEAAETDYESAVKASRRARPKNDRVIVGYDEDKEPTYADPESDEDESGDATPPVKPTPPTLRRNVVGDITMESMDAIMEQNSRGLLQVLDEASTLTTSMNQYRGGKGSDRQWYMSAWSGQPRIVDRKGNAGNVPIRVPHPFLGIIGGMVPDMIGSFCDEKGRHDGFIDRILFTYPDPVPKADWHDDGLPDVVAAGWSGVIGRLQARVMRAENLKAVPHVVQFDPDGQRAWKAMIDAHRAEQRAIDFPQSLSGLWAKLEQYAGRITLILHMLGLAADPLSDSTGIPEVSGKTVGGAARLLAYLKGHTRRVHEAMKARARGEEGSDDVQCILKWILRHRPESFSLRDLNRDLARTFGKRAKALHEALGWLVKQCCIRPQEAPTAAEKKRPGRSKSPVYVVNPHLCESQNCQNRQDTPASDVDGGRPVNSGDFATDSEATGGKEADDGYPPF